MIPIEIGRVVQSRAGRDKDRYFVVLALEEGGFCRIADGALRKVDAPKRKKLKHLTAKPELISSLQGKMNEGVRIFDSEVRKSLENLGYGRAAKEES